MNNDQSLDDVILKNKRLGLGSLVRKEKKENDENPQRTKRAPELTACIYYWLWVIFESAPLPFLPFSGPSSRWGWTLAGL